MRLSESLSKKVMESGSGKILNKFALESRRSVLFFEDIFAQYVRLCENAGYSGEIKNLSYSWGFLVMENIMQGSAERSPSEYYSLLSKVWANIGVLDNIQVEESSGHIFLETQNESITRIIGPNYFMQGFYAGVLSALNKRNSVIVSARQSNAACAYDFKLTQDAVLIKGKDRAQYNTLNRIKPVNSFTLTDAIQKNVFRLDGNKIYFRGRRLAFAENTVFHLFGSTTMGISAVKKISQDYFSEVIEKSVDKDSKLNLLKLLLQSMGWGVVSISDSGRRIEIYIENLPHGFQNESDNWDFLISTITGYMAAADRNLAAKDLRTDFDSMKLVFAY